MITSLKEINEHVTKKTHEKNDLVHTLKDKTQTLNERRKITKKIMRMSELELDQYFHMKFFDQVKDQMQTGDVCLCAGQEFFSKLIKKSTMCCFSHVMVVIKDPSPAVRKAYNIPNDETERVFIFESDSSTVDGRKGGGVQLITVKQAIQLGMDYYKTKDYLFVWRRLNGYKMTKEKEIALEQFMLRLCGKPYETHKMELAKAVLSLNKNEDYESVFCSELVAGTLKVLGLLGEDAKANNFVPADFTSEMRKDRKDIVLRNGAYFEKEVRVRLVPSDSYKLQEIK